MPAASNAQNNWLIRLVLIGAVAVVPLIVRVKIVDLHYLQAPVLGGWLREYDIYSWYKALAVILLGIAGFVLTLGRGIVWRPSMWVAVFLTATFFSALLSEHPWLAWLGFPNHFFGAVAIFALFGIFWTAQHARLPFALVGWPLAVSAVVIAADAMLEACNIELLSLSPIKELVLGQVAAAGLGLESANKQAMMTAATFYNSNYAGTYAAVTAPFLWVFAWQQRPWWRFTLAGMATCAAVAIGVVSESRTGMFGAGVGLLLAALYTRRSRRSWGLLAALAVACVVLVTTLRGGSLKDKILLRDNPDALAQTLATETLEVAGGMVRYKPAVAPGIMLAPASGGAFAVTDFAGKPLTGVASGEQVLFSIAPGQPAFALHGDPATRLVALSYGHGGFAIPLAFGPAGFSLQAWGGPQDSQVAPSSGLFKDRLFTSRGYIWSRSLPLLRKHILLGAGPDVFAVELEQRDFKAKMNAFWHPEVLVDKPHNFYIQVAHGSGVLAFGALIAVMLTAMYRVFILPRPLSAACAFGVAGFLVAGVFNDLYIGVAPLLAVFFGLMASPRELSKK